MTIEKRLENLEKLVYSLSKKIDNIKFYQDADNQGMRQGIGNVTPYTVSKTAYIGDIECIFYDVKQGNVSVFFTCEEGCSPAYTMERYDTTVAIYFSDALECVTTVTLSVI